MKLLVNLNKKSCSATRGASRAGGNDPEPSSVKSWRQDAIYVWRLDLPAAFPVSRQLSGILSQSEQQRADKFRFDNDRLKFVAAHAALRQILSIYLNLEPARIEFSE